MAESPQPAPRWPPWMEDWVLPYLYEPVLWPVLLAILGHVVLVFALGALSVLRGTGFWALALSLALTAGLSSWEIRVIGRPGGLSLSLLGTWAVAIALTVLAVRTGLL